MNESKMEHVFGEQSLKTFGKVAIWGVPILITGFLTLGQSYIESRIIQHIETKFVLQVEYKEFLAKRAELLSEQANFNKEIRAYMDDGNRLKGEFKVYQKEVDELRSRLNRSMRNGIHGENILIPLTDSVKVAVKEK